MSMLSCPLCGRLVSVRYFKPEDRVEDVQVVTRRSLGRGRGFQVTGRYSVLHDVTLMERIASRLHLLLDLIEGKEAGDGEATVEAWKAEVLKLRGSVDELESELEAKEDKVEEYRDEFEAWKAEVEGVVSRINNAFNSDYADLDDAVGFLLEVALED